MGEPSEVLRFLTLFGGIAISASGMAQKRGGGSHTSANIKEYRTVWIRPKPQLEVGPPARPLYGPPSLHRVHKFGASKDRGGGLNQAIVPVASARSGARGRTDKEVIPMAVKELTTLGAVHATHFPLEDGHEDAT